MLHTNPYRARLAQGCISSIGPPASRSESKRSRPPWVGGLFYFEPSGRCRMLAHFRHAHTANECLLLSDKQTITAGNQPAPKSILDTRNDELVRKHIDDPPLTRSQFATYMPSLSYIPRNLSIDATSEASRNLLGVRHCGNPGGLRHRSERPGHADLTHSWQ
jgi:hypothetical protein